PIRNKVYHDLKTLNADIRHYLDIHNNTPFQKRPESRKELFDRDEKEALSPLPSERYEHKHSKYATVTKTSHISLSPENHYYSIPYIYIGKKVKVVYSASYVSVFYDGERIAFHKRNLKERGYTSVKDHMPSAHRFVSDWNPGFFLKWAKGIHPEVLHYLQVILDSYTYPEQSYKSCLGILGYDKKAGRDRLINAVKRAIHYNTYNYSVITRILNSGMDSIPLDTDERPGKPVEHENIRGRTASNNQSIYNQIHNYDTEHCIKPNVQNEVSRNDGSLQNHPGQQQTPRSQSGGTYKPSVAG